MDAVALRYLKRLLRMYDNPPHTDVFIGVAHVVDHGGGVDKLRRIVEAKMSPRESEEGGRGHWLRAATASSRPSGSTVSPSGDPADGSTSPRPSHARAARDAQATRDARTEDQ